MHHEVGLAIGQYPDGLTDSNYGNINCADNGGCSIGLLQWHESNGIKLLQKITEADSNWESYWSDKSLTTYKSLKSGSINYNNFGSSWTLTVGSVEYNAIKSMLVSDQGKVVQREQASSATASNIEKLQTTYGVTNPAILIYCADIMNQYGSYINNSSSSSNLKGCMDYAGKCNQTDYMTGLDSFVTWWKSHTSNYLTRRDTTYTYIKSCYDQGKLSTGGSTDQGDSGTTENSAVGNGQYCMPVNGRIWVSADWGGGGTHGYSSSPHNGIDLAIAEGTPIYACTSGKATYKTTSSGYGKHVILTADDGNILVFGHMSAFKGSNRTVKKGDLIGYVGSTGNSTGPHVHVGITAASNGESGLYNANWKKSKNPSTFLGIAYKKHVYINA